MHIGYCDPSTLAWSGPGWAKGSYLYSVMADVAEQHATRPSIRSDTTRRLQRLPVTVILRLGDSYTAADTQHIHTKKKFAT